MGVRRATKRCCSSSTCSRSCLLALRPKRCWRTTMRTGTMPPCWVVVPGKPQQLPPAPPYYYPIPRGNSILGVIYGVLLWADMNAATPLGHGGALYFRLWWQHRSAWERMGPCARVLRHQCMGRYGHMRRAYWSWPRCVVSAMRIGIPACLAGAGGKTRLESRVCR